MLAGMRITIDIDDELMGAAQQVAGVAAKAAVIEIALRALVATAARQRLAAMHGALPKVKAPSRRRVQ